MFHFSVCFRLCLFAFLLFCLLSIKKTKAVQALCKCVPLPVCSVSRPSHPYRGTSAWFRWSWCSLWEAWKTSSETWWGLQPLQTPVPLPRCWCRSGWKYPSEPSGFYSHTHEPVHKYLIKHLHMSHLNMSACFSLLHCPHWLFVLPWLTEPIIPVAFIFLIYRQSISF